MTGSAPFTERAMRSYLQTVPELICIIREDGQREIDDDSHPTEDDHWGSDRSERAGVSLREGGGPGTSELSVRSPCPSHTRRANGGLGKATEDQSEINCLSLDKRSSSREVLMASTSVCSRHRTYYLYIRVNLTSLFRDSVEGVFGHQQSNGYTSFSS